MRAGLGGRAVLALTATVLALGLCELGVRQWAPQEQAVVAAPPAQPPSLLRGMFTQPGDHPVRTDVFDGVVHVNAQGFVDGEWGPRRADIARVLVIGDSFIQAAQVPLQDGYGRVLARDLSVAAGRKVEVLSLGVPGAGTGTALLLARQWVAQLQPDVIVVGFTTSNDVLNNSPVLDPKPDKPFFRLDEGQLLRVAPAPSGPPAWAQGWVWEHSDAVRLVGRRLWVQAQVKDKLRRGEGLPAELRVHDPAGGATWEAAWAVTDALVGALADAAGERAFVTVLIPDQVECSVAGRQRAIQRWPRLADWDLDAARLRSLAIADRHGPVIDLCPALLAAETPDQPLYLSDDGHWTVKGHAVAAWASVPGILNLLLR